MLKLAADAGVAATAAAPITAATSEVRRKRFI
jgi:hypothetical protein